MTPPSARKNFPQNKEYELSLLLKPDQDYKELREYLDEYIELVLGKFNMSQAKYDQLYHALHADIPIAAERYLRGRSRMEDYKFSTYFSWYVAERLNASSGLKRKPRKRSKI